MEEVDEEEKEVFRGLTTEVEKVSPLLGRCEELELSKVQSIDDKERANEIDFQDRSVRSTSRTKFISLPVRDDLPT